MKKLLDNPYFVGLLVLIAIVVIFRNPIMSFLKNYGKSEPVPAAAIVTNAIAKVQQIVPKLSEPQILPDAKIEVDNIQWILRPVRNPFERVKGTDLATKTNLIATSPDKQGEILRLTAIWKQTDKSLAVINNKVVTEGESILGYKVAQIEQDYVVLTNELGKIRLDFGEPQSPVKSGQKEPQKPTTTK